MFKCMGKLIQRLLLFREPNLRFRLNLTGDVIFNCIEISYGDNAASIFWKKFLIIKLSRKMANFMRFHILIVFICELGLWLISKRNSFQSLLDMAWLLCLVNILEKWSNKYKQMLNVSKFDFINLEFNYNGFTI